MVGTEALRDLVHVVLTGGTSRRYAGHRNDKFLRFMRTVAKAYHRRQRHVFVDNYATHSHPAVRAWLAKHPRIHLHFTPTSRSWLNLVEVFFGIISRQAIRRGTSTSVAEHPTAIRRFIDGWNDRCQPFTWTKTPDQILASALRKTTSDARHMRGASRWSTAMPCDLRPTCQRRGTCDASPEGALLLDHDSVAEHSQQAPAREVSIEYIRRLLPQELADLRQGVVARRPGQIGIPVGQRILHDGVGNHDDAPRRQRRRDGSKFGENVFVAVIAVQSQERRTLCLRRMERGGD